MKRREWVLLVVLISSAYLAHVELGMRPLSSWDMGDFSSYYFAGVGFQYGLDVYNFHLLSRLGSMLGGVYPYLYPPPLAFYIAPLSLLLIHKAAIIWLSMLVVIGVLVVVNAYLVSLDWRDGMNSQKPLVLLVLTVLLLGILPFGNNLLVGQVNILVLAFMSAAFLQSMIYKRDVLAGFLLAPAVLIKVTPLGFLLFFVMNRRYRTLYGFAIGLMVFAAPTLLHTGGLLAWKNFLQLSSAMGYGKTIPGLFSPASPMNLSIAGCVARFVRNPLLAGWVTVGVLGVLGCVLLMQHYRLAKRGQGEWMLLSYSVLMVIGAPYAYLHHVIYIFPGLLLCCAGLVMKGSQLSFISLFLLLVLAVIAGTDFPLYYNRLGLDATALRSLNLYALLGLFMLGLVLPARLALSKPVETTENDGSRMLLPDVQYDRKEMAD